MGGREKLKAKEKKNSGSEAWHYLELVFWHAVLFLLLSVGLFLTNDLILLLPRLTNNAQLCFCLLNISQMFTHVKIKAYKIKIYYQCISFQGEAWGVAPSPLKRPTLLYGSPHHSLDFFRGWMFFQQDRLEYPSCHAVWQKCWKRNWCTASW